jgi:hypothetical protein
MGLILILIVGAALVVLGGPCLVLAILVCSRSPRTPSFWLPCLGSLLLSATAQYAFALAPFVRQGEYSFDLFLAPVWGWQLAAPPALALLIWLIERTQRRPAVLGVLAGLLFSIPAVIGLTLPLGFVVPSLLGLQATH